jgi:hypothetical protein
MSDREQAQAAMNLPRRPTSMFEASQMRLRALQRLAGDPTLDQKDRAIAREFVARQQAQLSEADIQERAEAHERRVAPAPFLSRTQLRFAHGSAR